MKVLICPDKFKGSLTADEVSNAVERGLFQFDSTTDVVKLPLADGGEGTLDVLEVALNAKRIWLNVNDPLQRPVHTYYLKKGKTAFIEMAKASGLQLLSTEERNPLMTSTFGTGQMIKHSIEEGASDIYLLIGGSATNDGGIGMASALGYEFLNDNTPIDNLRGGSLPDIQRVIENDAQSLLNNVRFTVLSDVQNTLLGENGASAIYGSQKGGSPEGIELLDKGLTHLASILDNRAEDIPGSGAAGGLGYGAISFLDATIKSGIESLMEVLNFSEHLKNVDLIITGEGKLDSQTLSGKVVSGVLEVAKVNNIPIGIICGILENSVPKFETENIYEIRELAKDLNDAMSNADHYVEELAFKMISAL